MKKLIIFFLLMAAVGAKAQSSLYKQYKDSADKYFELAKFYSFYSKNVKTDSLKGACADLMIQWGDKAAALLDDSLRKKFIKKYNIPKNKQ